MRYRKRQNTELSILQQMNAAVKLLCFFLSFAVILSSSSILSFAVMLCFTGAVVYLSEQSYREVLSVLRSVSGLSAAVFVLDFLFPGAGHMARIRDVISFHSAAKAFATVLRINAAVLLISALRVSTDEEKLTSGFSVLLSPLSFFGIKVREIAFILSESIAFVPEIREKLAEIGYMRTLCDDLPESRGAKRRIRELVSLYVPAFVQTIGEAEELALSIEARGGIPDRPLLSEDELEISDVDILALTVCLSVFIVRFIILG